jgi:hypothetical protein
MGSIRDGLNGAVGLGFVAGSRFKGSIRDGLNGTAGLIEASASGGGLARTGSRGARAASLAVWSGWQACKQGFNAGAPREAQHDLLGDRCASGLRRCLLAIEPAPGLHRRNAATASGNDG